LSKYWYLHCKQCDIDHAAGCDIAEGFNHGQHILRAIYQLREHIVAINSQDQSDYLSVAVMGHYGTDHLWDFLKEHHDHELDLQSEYGDTEPIVEGET
jgi:hypothetical protein